MSSRYLAEHGRELASAFNYNFLIGAQPVFSDLYIFIHRSQLHSSDVVCASNVLQKGRKERAWKGVFAKDGKEY